ncbi:MAG: hypothetical protein P8P83_02385 [Rickettsiaceae bacterium]|nr:hypothetical protein [Rickettsiaceae bacterium]
MALFGSKKNKQTKKEQNNKENIPNPSDLIKEAQAQQFGFKEKEKPETKKDETPKTEREALEEIIKKAGMNESLKQHLPKEHSVNTTINNKPKKTGREL